MTYTLEKVQIMELAFAGPINLSNSNGSSEFPQIAASGNNVFVVWKDNSTGNDDIYLRGVQNNGTRFEQYQ